MIKWLTGAFTLFLVLPTSLGAIWFGLTQDLRNSAMILGGFVGLLLTYKVAKRFDWD